MSVLEIVAVPVCAPASSRVAGVSGSAFGGSAKVVGDVADGGGITVLRWSSPSASASDSVY